MGKNPPERRQYTRIKKHFILTYFDLAYPEVKHEVSQLKNISLGGMCIITSKPYAPKTGLGIEMKTPFISELTHLEGMVLESQEKIKDVIYETRLRFIKLDPQARFVLDKLIQYFEKEDQSHYD